MTDDRIAEIQAASDRGSAEWDDPIADARYLLGEVSRLREQVNEMVEGDLRLLAQDRDLRAAVARGYAFADYLESADGTISAVATGQSLRRALESAAVVGGEATPTETPEPIVRVRRINSCCGRAGGCWYWVCAICDDCRSPLMQQSTARQGAASHEDTFHSPAAVPVPAETPESKIRNGTDWNAIHATLMRMGHAANCDRVESAGEWPLYPCSCGVLTSAVGGHRIDDEGDQSR